MTAEPAPVAPELPEGVRLRHGQWYGPLIIEWPAARAPRVLPAFAELCAYELDMEGAERMLPCVTRLTLNAAPDGITADVETLIGHDGEPAGGVKPATGYLSITDDMLKKDENGEFATAVFRYMIAEVRVTDVWARGRERWPKPASKGLPGAEGNELDDEARAALVSLGWTPPGTQARAGQVLTASDPEPPAGTIVRDSCGGGEWYRSDEGDYWLKQKNDYADPETWTKVAGNYGPVTVLEWGDEDVTPDGD